MRSLESASSRRAVARWIALMVATAASFSSADASAQQDAGFANPGVPIGGMGGFGGGSAGSGGMVPPFFGQLLLVHPGQPIPSNGGLLIQTGDSFTTPTVTISNTATPGTSIGGTVTNVNGVYWVWVPTAPIEPGTYNVTLTQPDGGGGVISVFATVTVTAAWTPTVPQIDTAPSASWIGQLIGSECCQTWIEGFGLDFGNCFSTQQTGMIELSPGLTSPAPLAEVNQYLFRLRPAAEDESLFQWTGWGLQSVLTFTVQAGEYCFELDAMDITTGAVTTYMDLSPKCATHGALDDLGNTPIDVDDSSLDHFLCNSPPAAFEERWCDLNEDACAEAGTSSGCQVYGHVCRDEPLPTVNFGFGGMFGGVGGFGAIGGAGIGVVGGVSGASGIGGASGASGASGDSGGAGGDDKDDEDNAEVLDDDKGDSGCSVSDVQARSSTRNTSAAWLLLALGAVVTFRRRKRG